MRRVSDAQARLETSRHFEFEVAVEVAQQRGMRAAQATGSGGRLEPATPAAAAKTFCDGARRGDPTCSSRAMRPLSAARASEAKCGCCTADRRRLKLSQRGDARGIDFVMASGCAAPALRVAERALRAAGARWSPLEPAGVVLVLVGWTAGDPPY
ncbi:hypothetical protein TASIC1_0004021100 [Trichoderma asperellum]|uniref:Uncharacterized protein n=1 Tax=Trichoderma asperellum TaxID=101201 RepID=A0A6V8QPY9_TRIAP|nr:hypothetical protein TASIC1_0004021100 [Trichoderma asperellum]